MKDKQAFTLIELLVVVLIIGILASVALPQYQKAVEKSKATQALTLLKSVGQAALTYQLANGEYPSSFDELAIEIPWTGTTSWYSSCLDTRSNNDWSLQMYKTMNTGALLLYAGRLTGPYKGGGFVFVVSPGEGTLYANEVQQFLCAERISGGVTFGGTAGSYCKLFNATQLTSHGETFRSYRMP